MFNLCLKSSITRCLSPSFGEVGPLIPRRSMVIMKRYTKQVDPKQHQLEELEHQQLKIKEKGRKLNPPQYKRIVRNYNITPPNYSELLLTMKEPPSTEGQKKLNVAVIGAPNAGKSSLVNTLVGEKLNEGNIFTDTFITSATNNIHTDTLKDYLFSKAIDGKWEFNNEIKTDQTDIFRASEIVKEKIYEKMRLEIPYQVTQNTIGWTTFTNGDLRIDQDLIVKKDSHKSAILGRNGQTIKAIYLESRKELEKVFNRRIHLFLTVKVKKSEQYDD
ncbi:hypothetical protein PPL_06392 [Heterostelium album PN500]|uniref:KH type-2 domain-containing protein n=1 Tax=Heterostelium pallidum (strain ATCC 26659 / Pp 5 / PN500) TaxID=670386 RepID=D3BD13_HETP5|nr:hypothetical protein PPL_06392 [Heterostelium album PN500]EFA80805.1 hypothetical protein PPL_06392 [Heterostelium album PN500]|eukprot:XP_020432924.1 hypothetical protein PPL_06392 [Heterostelium album PN500]